jgi:conjugative relaxase-like TrwC/TraI family protein
MLNIGIIKNVSGAMRYFSPEGHDYWVENKDTRTFFDGKLAERLGLGEFDLNKLHALLMGIDPRTMKVSQAGRITGDQLTPGKKESKRPGYEVTVDGPKDLGALMALGLDERIVPEVLERAGRDVMQLMQEDAQTRVRIGKQNTDRKTGNILYAGVVHLTARPEGGKIDFQPHIHFLVPNVTYDATEKRFKALQLQEFVGNGSRTARPYYMAYFNNQLANYMKELGYAIERDGDSFKVIGIPDRVRQEFSQRRQRIKKTAKELGISEDSRAFQKLAMTTREEKEPGRSWESLMDHWHGRVTSDERKAILETVIKSRRQPVKLEADRSKEAVDWALEHLLERSSVVQERQVVTEALKHSLGQVSAEAIWKEMGRPDLIRREVNGRTLVTTKAVLAEEHAMVSWAVKGRGRFQPLASAENQLSKQPTPRQADLATLSPSQQAAIRHAWSSTDRVTMIRGLAGTGKTTLTKTLLAGVNVPYVVLAPSADASRGELRKAGFSEADTLAKFLIDEKFQDRARNGLIVLDEASLAGSRDMSRLFKMAQSVNSRVLLLGDRRQHKSVARGDVLALLEDRAGLPVAEVSDIKRQSGDYKRAVELLAKGRMAEGFTKLDKLGWVKDGGLVDDFMEALKTKKPGQEDRDRVIVVAPTHAEGDKLTVEIRERLKAEGRLHGTEHTFERLVPLHLTEAQKREGCGLEDGAIVQVGRNVGKLRAGDRMPAAKLDDAMRAKASFNAFKLAEISLQAGDTIRITANSKDITGKHRLDNGAVYGITGFTDEGNVRLNNGWVLDKGFGHWQHGYVTTSHAAQGKTVDRVLISIGPESYPAAGKDQFYVSVSRGRQQATVYTSQKEELVAAICREDSRILASDLVRLPPKRIRKRLKDRVAHLRDIAAHVTTRVHDFIKQREFAHGQ